LPPPKPKCRWFHFTPEHLLAVLLIVEGILLLFDWFHWFPKGWAVLISIEAVVFFLVLVLLWFIINLLFHWRFQYSIRTLLVLMMAVAIPASWLAVEMERARAQKESVEIFGEACVYQDERAAPFLPTRVRQLLGKDFFADVVQLWFHNTKVNDAGLEKVEALDKLEWLHLAECTEVTDIGLAHLKGLNQLKVLVLHNTRVTDAGLKCLNGLRKLRLLNLDYTEVTDVGLKHLKELNYLRELDLNDTKVTDTGLEYLIAELKELEYLNLSSTQITDKGLERVRGLNHLEALLLESTRVTDAGLEHLKPMNKLQRLDLRDTNVTHEGVKNLKQALPTCDIEY
jgi:hypothetical protein